MHCNTCLYGVGIIKAFDFISCHWGDTLLCSLCTLKVLICIYTIKEIRYKRAPFEKVSPHWRTECTMTVKCTWYNVYYLFVFVSGEADMCEWKVILQQHTLCVIYPDTLTVRLLFSVMLRFIWTLRAFINPLILRCWNPTDGQSFCVKFVWKWNSIHHMLRKHTPISRNHAFPIIAGQKYWVFIYLISSVTAVITRSDPADESTVCCNFTVSQNNRLIESDCIWVT